MKATTIAIIAINTIKIVKILAQRGNSIFPKVFEKVSRYKIKIHLIRMEETLNL